MKEQREMKPLTEVTVIAGLVALSTVGTLLVRIPIPATTGYFNVGDVFVMLAALWLGPRAGLIVGAVGPAVADAIGFPQFILATAITKGLEGLFVGMIAGRGNENLARKVVAVSIGALIMVAGYFAFEAFIYPKLSHYAPMFGVTDYAAALVEAPFNVVQGIIGAAASLSLWKALVGWKSGKSRDPDSG